MVICYRACTRPKLRFPTCPKLPKHDIPHISYTYLAEDKAKFMQTNELCRKSCPILQISCMYEIQIFLSSALDQNEDFLHVLLTKT